MEICFPCSSSVGEAISSNSGSSTEPLNPAHCNSRDLSAGDLETCLTQHLNIEESEISTACYQLSPKKNDIVHVVRKDGSGDSHKSKSSCASSEKCFSKCATFPSLGGPKSSVNGLLGGKKDKNRTSEVSEVNPVNQCYSRSMSLPSPQELVSAIKGTRKKLGIIPEKLSVTWAPDVYDPIPTSVSHVPSSNKNQRYRNDRKKYKNKQKGSNKSSRGKGKDKKQPQKNNANSSNKIKPFDDGGGLSEPQVRIGDYDVGSPDPFCGSSFLKNSVAKLHFKVTEAT